MGNGVALVPHLTVEQKIAEALRGAGGEQEGPVVVVVGIPDEKRGESLVALSTVAIEQAELRRKLVELGLPNLWIPKVFRQVGAIPLLATGKLDLRGCQRLAEEREEPVVAP